MKLCRFDLLSSPGTVRSGIVHGGKIYETDGVNPIAVHEPGDARLLAPVGRPPSLRLFSAAKPAYVELIESQSQSGAALGFSYLNPACLSGPNAVLPTFGPSSEIACKPCVAFVMDDAGRGLRAEDALGHVLGLSLAAVFYAVDLERQELATGFAQTRSHEVGIGIGPALTTPDELEDAFSSEGRHLAVEVRAQVDGVEFLRSSLDELPWGLGELAAFASESAPIVAGDTFLVALGSSRLDSPIQPGSDVRVLSDRLGTLFVRYGA